MMQNTELRKVTKRLVMSVAACAMVWWFLDKHRDWTWAYFESVMGYPDAGPELTAIAQASISAITSMSIAGISAITAIAIWFVTGNVLALRTMFQFGQQSVAAATTETRGEHRTEQSVDERIVREFADKYRDDLSYRPLDTLQGVQP